MIPARAIDIARDFIAEWEGFESHAYADIGGVWSIGYGHTGDVESGDTISRAEGLALLESDMADAVDCVDAHVDVALDDGQYAALISFTYNAGCTALAGSTLLKLVNAGNFDGAAEQFKRWSYVKKVYIQGLRNRRDAEAALFRGEA